MLCKGIQSKTISSYLDPSCIIAPFPNDDSICLIAAAKACPLSRLSHFSFLIQHTNISYNCIPDSCDDSERFDLNRIGTYVPAHLRVQFCARTYFDIFLMLL